MALSRSVFAISTDEASPLWPPSVTAAAPLRAVSRAAWALPTSFFAVLTCWAALRTALSSSSFLTLKSLSPLSTAEPSATRTSWMMPSTSGVTTVEETGLMEPEADTESLNSPRVTNAVLMAGPSDCAPPWMTWAMVTAMIATTPRMTPTFMRFFLLRTLRWRMRLS